jgi:hypothetical protein
MSPAFWDSISSVIGNSTFKDDDTRAPISEEIEMRANPAGLDSPPPVVRNSPLQDDRPSTLISKEKPRYLNPTDLIASFPSRSGNQEIANATRIDCDPFLTESVIADTQQGSPSGDDHSAQLEYAAGSAGWSDFEKWIDWDPASDSEEKPQA